VCVCVCVCVCARALALARVCMYECVCEYVCWCTCTCMHVHMYARIREHKTIHKPMPSQRLTYTRTLPDTNGRTLHAAPRRAPSMQYAGGLSATYYTLAADTLEMARPLWSTPCTYGHACDETIDFSLAVNHASSQQVLHANN